ncbi:outer membrane beta-barrel protein [Pedobacter foliorum]|uniref:outer membrane beta-barrel protein n=1 Tax=Pedobacter foliorum TaxID=2739058 RepID=UPI0015679A81|nr:outer membrane beta-barrel protein [Pedobacter foliorum]NRF37467.1 outer membrane beta-barrel protein [Pedobacter foliorum]
MNRIFFALVFLFIFPLVSMAQKGSNFLQVSGQAAIPTGAISDVVKTGFGGAVKGIYGFSRNPQYLTLEAGYNRFAAKNMPAGASAHYSALPIYLGYRANLSGVVLESQGGVSFNRIAGSGPGGSASANQTAFGWAISAGYTFKDLELAVRYQSSEGNNDVQIIRFIGIRLGYNFGL